MPVKHGAFDIAYPVSINELESLHISIEDTIIYRYGKRKTRVYLVPNEDPEVYRECTRFLQTEERNAARRKRCITSASDGRVSRCNGNCSTCTRKIRDSFVSLDQMMENGFEFKDEEDPLTEVDDRETLNSILDRLEEIKPRYAYLLRRVLQGESGRSIARSEGKSAGTINEQIERAIRMAADIWHEDF